MAEALRDHTTLRLGGPARSWVRATTEDELVDAVRRADEAGEPLLVLGGGSNLVVADEGFPGTVVEVATSGIRADAEGDDPTCGGVVVEVAAGESWDGFVATAVERRWVGVEALSGIPGSVGATPIQNVGAYGQEVSQTLARVRVWDRRLRGDPYLRRCRLRVRLPHQPLQGRPVAPRRPRGHLPVPAGRARVRRSRTPSWPAPSASSRAPARR